jgi:hypothetical protein
MQPYAAPPAAAAAPPGPFVPQGPGLYAPPQPHAPGSTPIPAYGMPQPQPLTMNDLHPAAVDAHVTNVARNAAAALAPTPIQGPAAPGPQMMLPENAPQAPPSAPMMVGPVMRRAPGTDVYAGPKGQQLTVPGTYKPSSGEAIRQGMQAPIITPEDVDKAFPFLVGPFAIHKGIIKAGAAMTSPANAAIAAGTQGLGMIPGLTAKVASVGLSSYFATEAGKQLLEKYPPIKEAIAKKDWQTALELGGGALADAAMFYGAGAHAVKGALKEVPTEIVRQRQVAAEKAATAPTANTTGIEPYRPPATPPAQPEAKNPRQTLYDLAYRKAAREHPDWKQNQLHTYADDFAGPEPAQPVAAPVQTVAETPHVTQAPPPKAAPKVPAAPTAAPPAQPTIEKPTEPSDGKQQTAAVDAGTTGAVDTGRTGEGPALHGAPTSGARPETGRRPGRGEATDVVVPGEDRSIPAHYDVRELSDVQSSHNGLTFSANPDYRGQNERDYSKPENQQRVIEQSSEERFEPRYHINDNPDMVNGPPLIDEDGNALGGNSRTMQLQRVYGRDGAKASAYRALLEKKAAQYGIDPETIRGMRQPVLVRVATPEGLEALPGGSKWAVRKTNIAGTAALSASERAAADAGQMSPEMVTHIAGAIEDAGPDATLNDALTGPSGTRIVNRLIADGFFSEQERPALMDGKTGVLTQGAKDRIAKALVGKFFRNSDQIARTPAAIKNKLERVAAPLAKVAGNPEWDITPEVREAIDLLEHASAHGIKNLSDVVNQTSMFGEAPKWPDGVVKLAQFLRDGKPNDVVNAFRKYVNSKEPTMFGESTPAEAFADAFGAEKPARATEPESPKPPPPPPVAPAEPPAQRLAAPPVAEMAVTRIQKIRDARKAGMTFEQAVAKVDAETAVIPAQPPKPEVSGMKGHLVLAAEGVPTRNVPVTDAEQASAIWSKFRDDNGFGASDLKPTSGWLVGDDGKKIGHVSYNGRIWAEDGTLLWPEEKPAKTPPAAEPPAQRVAATVKAPEETAPARAEKTPPPEKFLATSARNEVMDILGDHGVDELDLPGLLKKSNNFAYDEMNLALRELLAGGRIERVNGVFRRIADKAAVAEQVAKIRAARKAGASLDEAIAQLGAEKADEAQRLAAGPAQGAQPVAAKAEPTPELPPEPSVNDRGPVYMGSLLGGLEPLFRDAKAAGDELRRTRNDALEAAKAAKGKPEERAAGVALRAWYTAERDLWAARAHQYIDIITRKVLPKIQEREAVGIAREFRHKPRELEQFIDGTHPFLDQADGGRTEGMKRLAKLMPVMKSALRMLHDGMSPREKAADIVYTNLAEDSLKEGRAGGWLESRWLSDEYMPHLANAKGEGELPLEPSTAGRRQGKIGKYFGFAQRRADPYPTMVHAVADGLIPKTLDPSAAMNIHADQFARARASHMLEAELAREGLGRWGGPDIEGWVPFAAHSNEFEKDYGYSDINTGEMKTGKVRLYVPEYIDKAFSPITDPDYLAKIPGFAKLRTFQRGLKQAILGLSGFHLLTENFMAKSDIGPSGMWKALTTSREAPETLINEQDLIHSGGTTSIQGGAITAYRNLKPGTIPTRGEVIRAYIPGSKEVLELADKVTEATFDNVQRRYKIWGFAIHRDAWLADNPNATPQEFAAAKRGIASFTNGVFGGLHWENMGVSRATVEIGRLALLAPDWTGSNLALAKYAMGAPLSLAELRPRWAGGQPLRGAMTKTAVEARLARAFFVKQLVQGLTETQALSLMFSGQLSHRPFQVYLGKDKNGEDVYQNVVFRGAMGDIISYLNKIEEHGLLLGTGVFIGTKSAPVTKAGIHVLTTRDDLGRPITPPGMNPLVATARSVGSVAADVSPVPLIMRSTAKTLTGDGSDKYLWSERALTLFGPPAQHVAPAGTHMSGGVLRPNAPREENTALEQAITGNVYKKRGAR